MGQGKKDRSEIAGGQRSVERAYSKGRRHRSSSLLPPVTLSVLLSSIKWAYTTMTQRTVQKVQETNRRHR